MQKPDTAAGAYYVSAVDGARKALLFGPFMNNHAAALAKVDEVRRMAESLDPRAAFYSFGTCRLEGQKTYPVGTMNNLPDWPAST